VFVNRLSDEKSVKWSACDLFSYIVPEDSRRDMRISK